VLEGVEAFLTEEGAPDAIAISRAIYDSGGAFAGVVTSRIAIPVLEAVVVETLTSLQNRNSTLTEVEYQIIAEDGVAYVDSDLAHKSGSNFSTLGLRSLELARQGPAGYIEEMNLRRHIPVITGYSLTRGWGQPDGFRWTVLVRIPTASLVQPVQNFHLKVVAVGVAIVVPIFLSPHLDASTIAEGMAIRPGGTAARHGSRGAVSSFVANHGSGHLRSGSARSLHLHQPGSGKGAGLYAR
jgi:hypothetical protein